MAEALRKMELLSNQPPTPNPLTTTPRAPANGINDTLPFRIDTMILILRGIWKYGAATANPGSSVSPGMR